MENLISVGHTKKSHGLKGELKVQIEEQYLDDFLAAETIFLEIKGKKLPFFVESIREGNEVLVKLEGVDSREAADNLASKELFLREEDLASVEETTADPDDFTQYIGYHVHDTELGVIGAIEDIFEYPQQMMAALTYQNREVLLPMHAAFIKNIQSDNKIILMELPEGLLEL
jgi:16S rRNA processing protein RimM